MRAIAKTMLTAVAALAAGAAAAHPGHTTLGPLAGALHLHAHDIALALVVVGLVALLAPGAWQHRASARPSLRAIAASGRARAIGGVLAGAAVLVLLFG